MKWFQEKFLRYLTPVSIGALLVTLVLLFSFKGELIIKQPQVIFLIAIPSFYSDLPHFCFNICNR